MTLKIASLTLLAAAAAAQSPAPPAHPTPHHTPSTTKASNIPRVPGIPKTLYALKYIDIKAGVGPLAEPRKYYTVRYTGWLKDGTKFDSSYDHPGGEPLSFPYGAHRVIPGWDTGFQGMRVGGKRRLFIPYQLAYGEAGRPPVIPAKADLIFDLELVSQSDTPPASKPPPTQPPPPPQPGQPTPPPSPNPQPKPAEATPNPSASPTPQPTPAPTSQPATPPHPESR